MSPIAEDSAPVAEWANYLDASVQQQTLDGPRAHMDGDYGCRGI